jgi:hypothetical protein
MYGVRTYHLPHTPHLVVLVGRPYLNRYLLCCHHGTVLHMTFSSVQDHQVQLQAKGTIPMWSRAPEVSRFYRSEFGYFGKDPHPPRRHDTLSLRFN